MALVLWSALVQAVANIRININWLCRTKLGIHHSSVFLKYWRFVYKIQVFKITSMLPRVYKLIYLSESICTKQCFLLWWFRNDNFMSIYEIVKIPLGVSNLWLRSLVSHCFSEWQGCTTCTTDPSFNGFQILHRITVVLAKLNWLPLHI